MGHQEHEQRAQAELSPSIRCGVITISDTRTPATDTSGAAICALVEAAGHTVTRYQLVKDEPDQIAALVREVSNTGCQVILTNGGTGIARRDSTFEAIDALIDKRLPGFGELFRMLSYQEIGAAAMLSRACGGLIDRTVVLLMPGSTPAVRLAMDRLILPELGHLVELALKGEAGA